MIVFPELLKKIDKYKEALTSSLMNKPYMQLKVRSLKPWGVKLYPQSLQLDTFRCITNHQALS